MTPIIFLHLPKTGGTSLRDVIARPLRGRKAFRFDGGHRWRDEFAALPEVERDSFDLLDGHWYYGLHRLLPRPAAYVTMLREPVDRVLSFYYWVLRTPTHHFYKWLEGGRTLRDAIEQGASRELDNFQTRLLAGDEAIGVPFGGMDRGLLDRAKANLRTFAAVGLTDRFDESLALFALAFGWKDVACERFKEARGRARAADLEPDLIEMVRRTNRLDAELYTFAQELFEERLLAAGPALGARLMEVRARQAMHETSGREPPPEPSLVGGVWRL